MRECQTQAFEALSDYYAKGGEKAACVMSVGAGKTALGVVSSLAFTRRRALVVTPGSVIRGVFDRAFDHTVSGNVLYGLPGGPSYRVRHIADGDTFDANPTRAKEGRERLLATVRSLNPR